MPPSTAGTRTPSEGARALQDCLHELLTRLASVSDLVKNWPESSEGNDSSVHMERTTRLIAAIRQLVAMIVKTEGAVKSDSVLKQSLQSCLIPLDLLDLLDHGGGLNPDCFSRGILKEALGQLAGLTRRKLALEMLGAAVQQGINLQDAQRKSEMKESTAKREREVEVDDGEAVVLEEPPTKRVKTEPSSEAKEP